MLVKNRFLKPKTEFQAKRIWGAPYLKGQESPKYGSHLVYSYLTMASSFPLLTSCSACTYHPDFELKKPVSVDYGITMALSAISLHLLMGSPILFHTHIYSALEPFEFNHLHDWNQWAHPLHHPSLWNGKEKGSKEIWTFSCPYFKSHKNIPI